MYRDLKRAGTVSEAFFEDARVKARGARVACGYDPAILEAGDDEEDAGMDHIEEDAWYEDAYPGGGGNSERGDGDGPSGQANGTARPSGDQ